MTRLNNKGFTMLEMLFSFTVTCMIVSFLPLSFQLILKEQSIENRIQRMEWEVFISQLKQEIQSCDHYSIGEGILNITINGVNITFEKYNTNIRRRVSLQGHEIALQHVKSIVFEERVQQIYIEVVDTSNQTYISYISPFVQTGDSYE
ncbi:competence type IV pilus minor pilin ComGF (plasmid) [Bacillus sp. 31A1R]|uniref:Competence type IV pilus minor pilin ComGF n=1 Tax=Robertmurraya mangrovi TaxID=3098077 RepID=A0ABU5IV43_9BACI|nr:competence type IV pilus minor pilin ComGF [Bacillus sp. 31A1R]